MGELFLKLLDMSFAATWLIVAVILVRLLLNKAPKGIACLLWVLVAVRLICPVSFESRLSLMPESNVDSVIETAFDRMGAAKEQEALEAIGGADGPEVSFEVEVGGAVVPGSDPGASADFTAITIADLAGTIWLAGMSVLLLYALISYLRLRHRVAASVPLYEHVRLCDGIDSPFILGLFRPRIYLPSAIAQEELVYVLAHERAHLARRDHWWKPLGFMLLAVYWFNPLVWVAYILLCRDIELACDEKVIREMGEGEKKAYSQALLSCSVPRRMVAACPLAFGEVNVRGRIKSVLNYKKPAFWIIVAALVVCIVLAGCFLTDPIKPTVHDVTDQKGYGITAITTHVEMDIEVPTNVLGEDIYSTEGHVYRPDEVVVYQSETTSVYLEHVRYLEQYGEERLYFDFRFVYDIPDSGTVRELSTPNIKDGKTISYSMGGGVANKLAWDNVTTYPEGARLYGVNQGVEISVAIKTDVVRNAADYIAFTMMDLTDITYEKGPANHEDEIVVKDVAAKSRYVNGMSMQELAIGEEALYPYPIVFFENGGWLDYQFTYSRSGLTVEYGLRSMDGATLAERIKGGKGLGRIKDIPAGVYELFFRNCEDNVVAVEAENTVTGAFHFTCGGEYGFSEKLVASEGVFVSTSTLKLGKEIAAQFGIVPDDYVAYYNFAVEEAIGVYDCITVRKQLDLSNGDKVPTYFLSPDKTTLIAVKQDKEGINYAWTFVRNMAGEWVVNDFQTKPSQSSASDISGADTAPEKRKLTLEVLKELAQKGEGLTWSDFEGYQFEDIGSGQHICRYEVDESYCLIIIGHPEIAPAAIRLCSRENTGDYIDIRRENIEEFLATGSDRKNEVPLATLFPLSGSAYLVTDGSTGKQIRITEPSELNEMYLYLDRISIQRQVEETLEELRTGYRYAIRTIDEDGVLSDVLCVSEAYVQIGGKAGYYVLNLAPLLGYLEMYFLHGHAPD